MLGVISELLKHVRGGKGSFRPVLRGIAPGIIVPDSRLKAIERGLWQPRWRIERFESDLAYALGARPNDVAAFAGNLLLNEGIAEMWDLIAGLGTPTSYANANAFLGVGDSATAASATDTGLIATTNEAYVGMEAGYPQRSGQQVDWRSVFDGSTANFDWNEFCVANGNSDAAELINRLVSAQGTKASGQSWTLTLSITLSG